MKKELVKVGMKVSINEQLYSKVSKEKYPENKFYVLSLVENTDYTYYVSDTEGFYDYKTFSIDCADFEPYEEPKEGNGTYSTSDPLEIAWMKRMCAENKEEREEAENNLREILNLPKEETTTYQIKEIEQLLNK